MLNKTLDDAGSLGMRAYRRCKSLLLSATLPPGSVVSQTELSARLDVPVTPLRDALRTLQAEGLVQVMPRAGIRILRPDADLIRNTFQLRRLLEREAVRRFTEQADGAAIQALADRHAALRSRLSDLSHADLRNRFRELDRAFHKALIASLQNPVIATVYERNEDQVTFIRNHLSNLVTLPVVRQTLDEHDAILHALARRDPARAARAMDRHMDRALHRALGI